MPSWLKGRVAKIAPEDREQAEPVGLGKSLAHLLDLARRFLRTEIDRRSDGGCAEIERLLHVAEHDLVERVGVGEKLVVVELDDERDPVCVSPRDDAERSDCGRYPVAPALERKLDDVARVEVHRVWSERRRRAVLDALIDGQDGDVAAAGEPSPVEQALQVPQDLR